MARVLGCVLVAAMAALVVLMLVASPDKAGEGGPVFGVLLAAYLVAFLYGRPDLSAVATGVAAAVLWLAVVALIPPVSLALALLSVAVAGVVGVWLTRNPVAGLAAAMSSALLITTVAWALVTYGPERFVPVLDAPGAADPLLESRIEAPDPYVGLLALGALLAVVLVAVRRFRTVNAAVST
ncbi:hypothetical protein [Kutzneria chonburiensis]|uniref:Uncharacterized protein n=1 Tax=Kutzneria chonburiensis TaxID=1483604 RepID=A0ABV6MYN3_9PSEU|nr:hypothetical protein [Kutzneria chonburiensis]